MGAPLSAEQQALLTVSHSHSALLSMALIELSSQSCLHDFMQNTPWVCDVLKTQASIIPIQHSVEVTHIEIQDVPLFHSLSPF